MPTTDKVYDALARDIMSMYTKNGKVGGRIDGFTSGSLGGISINFDAAGTAMLLSPEVRAEFIDNVSSVMMKKNVPDDLIRAKLREFEQNDKSYLQAVLQHYLNEVAVDYEGVRILKSEGYIGLGIIGKNSGNANQTAENLNKELDAKFFGKIEQYINSENNLTTKEQTAYAVVLESLRTEGKVDEKSKEIPQDLKDEVKMLFDKLAESGVSKPQDVNPLVEAIGSQAGYSQQKLKELVANVDKALG